MTVVHILGRGPSLAALEELDYLLEGDIILVNNHARTLNNTKIAKKLRAASLYVMCNISQEGFIPDVLEKANVTSCLTNRLKPNWDLWREHKLKQRKHNEGGTLNNLGRLPYLAEDEPYLYTWRGPADRNHEVMTTYNDRVIEHMPEEAEQYLIQIYEDKLIGNCSFYATLYAILKLNADHIIYYGLDFYNNLKFKKSWYIHPPAYGTPEWWSARMAYEGEHMKAAYDNYLAKFFPDVTLEFFTLLDHPFKSPNIICNTIKIENPETANQTYSSE